jgi:hypothetical protein
MISDDDDFPFTSDDPQLQIPQAQLTAPAPQELEEQDLRILLRFLIGSAIEGNAEFWRRARLWQAEQERAQHSWVAVPVDEESEADHVRYALLGMFSQALDYGGGVLKSLNRASGGVYASLSRALAPLTGSRLMHPVRDNFDYLAKRGESLVETWIDVGRREERMSRGMVREQAYEDVVDDVLDYLAQKPEVRDLVQQQSVGMAGEVLGEVRERSSDVDAYLEARANAILRRSRRDDDPPPAT